MQANITFFVKIYGLFEALIALLIVFQDYVGGVLYISTLLANVVLVYGQKIVDKTVLEMTDYDQCKVKTYRLRQ